MPHAILVDDAEKPTGWILDEQLHTSDRVERPADPPFEAVIVELDDILRDALSDILAAESRYGIVVDEQGRARFALSLDAISHAINTDPSLVPSTTDLIALEEEEARQRTGELDATH